MWSRFKEKVVNRFASNVIIGAGQTVGAVLIIGVIIAVSVYVIPTSVIFAACIS